MPPGTSLAIHHKELRWTTSPGIARANAYGRRCAYCGVHEDDAGAELTVDHHRPRSKGGDDSDANLVYSCPKCNEFKGSYWFETDSPHIRLLNPGADKLTPHVLENEDGTIAGQSEEGTFFIARLRLNRPQLVAFRRRQRHDAALRATLQKLNERIQNLENQFAAMDALLRSIADEISRS